MQTALEICGGISASKLWACACACPRNFGRGNERGAFLLHKEVDLLSGKRSQENINFVKKPMFCQKGLDPMSFN